MKAEQSITDPRVCLHRIVVDPAWVHEGIVSPQAFIPRIRDQDRLSVVDKGATEVKALDEWKRRFPKSKANSCVTVTVELCIQQGLLVIDDSEENETHVSIDFIHVSDQNAVAITLAEKSKIWPSNSLLD